MLKNALQRQHPFLPALAGRDLARNRANYIYADPAAWRAAKYVTAPPTAKH
jgi:hypothetical protein